MPAWNTGCEHNDVGRDAREEVTVHMWRAKHDFF